MTWWRERLDKLRRDEQGCPLQRQPTLRLPLPPDTPPEADDEEERGIAVIDFAV